mmetsp:Transcript_7216/g.12181  ORF Transcript_7216/g.12181 Transcript_7216/m.12181 type:complete len:221 (-) Transcript_7216:46-708(-)|eukprot:CAMPEP_0119311380 /NCGR_PEP_ID=MMETSP1333-20130426/22201_1 /TAXON_ID=418940 /ORGANISM="Scyphosphaera apsteinii, Strain RCC1455" /LENGTH=220 /DNA_ID=CAMNT_0007315739 /DNA_START=49 /DNA_END=711 /DNA_ORIENTATION=-
MASRRASSHAPGRSGDQTKDREAYNAKREMENLQRVFNHLDRNSNGSIEVEELHNYLKFLGHKCKRPEVEDMIWEIDEDNDGCVNWEEFKNAYFRVKNDAQGWEPRRFFNVVEFMMHDKDFSGTIDHDECMEILFRRYGKSELMEAKVQDYIRADEDGDNLITFSEMLHMDSRNDKNRMKLEPGFRFSQAEVERTKMENRKLFDAYNKTLAEVKMKQVEP